MQTRRGFLGTAAAGVAAVAGGGLTAVAGHNDKLVYIRMSYLHDKQPPQKLSSELSPAPDTVGDVGPGDATGPAVWPTGLSGMSDPDAPDYGRVIVCSAKHRRHVVKLVNAVREVVWLPQVRSKANPRAVQLYMDAYRRCADECITYCVVRKEYRVLMGASFLFTAVDDMPDKLMKHDIILHDDCSNEILRRFKSSTKHGRTRTREVIRVTG